VTERTAFILRIRQLALGIAREYLAGTKIESASAAEGGSTDEAGSQHTVAEGEGG